MILEFQLIVITRWRLLCGRFRIAFTLAAFRAVLAIFACFASLAERVENGGRILDILKSLPSIWKRT